MDHETPTEPEEFTDDASNQSEFAQLIERLAGVALHLDVEEAREPARPRDQRHAGESFQVGGKGINVARTLLLLQQPPASSACMGAHESDDASQGCASTVHA